MILLIRHAEKPIGEVPPHGVSTDGVEDHESLTTRGWQRAGALVSLFGPDRDDAPGYRRALPTPTHLFASKVGPDSSSRRPVQTLEPLADRLGLAIDTRFLKEQVLDIVDAIRTVNGIVLVSWEHRLLPSMAARIVGDGTPVPSAWPSDRFDIVWVFEPARIGPGFEFRQVAQMLLAGDRPDPIG